MYIHEVSFYSDPAGNPAIKDILWQCQTGCDLSRLTFFLICFISLMSKILARKGALCTF